MLNLEMEIFNLLCPWTSEKKRFKYGLIVLKKYTKTGPKNLISYLGQVWLKYSLKKQKLYTFIYFCVFQFKSLLQILKMKNISAYIIHLAWVEKKLFKV